MVNSVEVNNNIVEVKFRPISEQSVEVSITEIIKLMVNQGVIIGKVHRGRSLEERYLELT
jgi:hypothetical protein